MTIKQILKSLKHSDLPYLLVLLLCCIAAYWPLSFFVYSLKNDALNYFLPVRYQVSEAISNGQWPFWSPYFNLGYPLHGDMQSGVWNPIVQFISLFGPYSLYTLQFETVLYVFVSGVGMFYLAKYFIIDKRICLVIAASYMLCGYNSDSAQFLNWISAASFLPFVILYSIRSIVEDSWRLCLTNGLFIYLFFVSAYPADFVLLLYLLLFFFAWQFFLRKQSLKKRLVLFAKKILISSITFTLLALPAIISYFQFLPLTERGAGASYSDAMSNPLHPGLFLSYVTPLAVWKAPFASVTDPLLRNSYFGLTAFAFLITGFMVKTRNPWQFFFKWAFIVSTIFSIGEIGGLRPLTYYVLPLMNTFRHPANARLFTIFFACIISSITIQHLSGSAERKKLKYSTAIIFLAFVLLSVLSLVSTPFLKGLTTQGGTITNQLKHLIESVTFPDLLFLNVLIQLPFLLFIYLYSKNKISLKTLAFVTLLNSVFHTFLQMPFTVVKKDKASFIQHILTQNIIKGYPLPDLTSSIEKNSMDGHKFFKEIGSSNMYNKKIGRIDYRITPSNLNTQNLFWKENSIITNELKQYPLLYKADTVVLLQDSAKLILNNRQRILFTNDFTTFDNSYFTNSAYSVIVNNFAPGNWNLTIISDAPGIYCLFQNFYPNWKIYIDGKESSVAPCNISFLSFQLDKGKHSVSLQYEAISIKMAFLMSLISLFLVIALILIKEHKKSGKAGFPLS